jgi:hypothetical protein
VVRWVAMGPVVSVPVTVPDVGCVDTVCSPSLVAIARGQPISDDKLPTWFPVNKYYWDNGFSISYHRPDFDPYQPVILMDMILV